MTQRAYELLSEPEASRVALEVPASGPALRLGSGFFLTPELAEGELRLGPAACAARTRAGGGRVLEVSAAIEAPVAGWLVNAIHALEERVVVEAWYTSDRAHAVRHWHVSQGRSALEAESLHAFVGQAKQWGNGTVFPGADAEIHAGGHNYGYCMAGPRIAAWRGASALVLGGTSLAQDFGLQCRVSSGALERLRFDYGGDVPLELEGQRRHHGPRLQIAFTDEQRPEAAHRVFVEAMERDGVIRPQRYAPEHAPFLRPKYCTWGDQIHAARTLSERDNRSGHKPTNAVLDETMVRRAADRIAAHELPVGTFVIDAGWQDRRGDWNAHPEKFPAMRALVDELHERGFRVILWFAPFLVEPDAAVRNRPELLAGPNAHNELVLDYERPETRDHVAQRIETFFSSGPDGWDIDGLKLDWLIEKAAPRPGPPDLAWRGEERCVNHIYRFIDGIARRHKPTFVLYGGASESPHMNGYSFATGVEERFDRASSDYVGHRAELLRALRPGAVISPHFRYHPEDAIATVRETRRIGGVPEIGVVLPEHVDDETLARTREALA